MTHEVKKYLKQCLCHTTRNSNEFGVFCLDESDAKLGKETEIFVGYVHIVVVPIKVYDQKIEIKEK